MRCKDQVDGHGWRLNSEIESRSKSRLQENIYKRSGCAESVGKVGGVSQEAMEVGLGGGGEQGLLGRGVRVDDGLGEEGHRAHGAGAGGASELGAIRADMAPEATVVANGSNCAAETILPNVSLAGKAA